MGRRRACRVASPLVMATRDSCVRLSPVRLASHSCLRLDPLPPASHGGSATREDERLPRRLLRLRCAPPSAMGTKATKCCGTNQGLNMRFPMVRAATSCAPSKKRTGRDSKLPAAKPLEVRDPETRPARPRIRFAVHRTAKYKQAPKQAKAAARTKDSNGDSDGSRRSQLRALKEADREGFEPSVQGLPHTTV